MIRQLKSISGRTSISAVSSISGITKRLFSQSSFPEIDEQINYDDQIRLLEIDEQTNSGHINLNPKPTSIISTSIIPTFINKSDFKDFSHFCSYKPSEELPTYKRTDRLPQVLSDIKGVDTITHKIIRKTNMLNKSFLVTDNNFFQLRFFSKEHFTSQFRKSTISMAVDFSKGYVMNSSTLENSHIYYDGKYRSLEFFKKRCRPYDSAMFRCKYRKFIRKQLFDTIHRLAEHYQLREPEVIYQGIYKFAFKKVAYSTEEKREMVESMFKGLSKLYVDRNAIRISEQRNRTAWRNKNEILLLERHIRDKKKIYGVKKVKSDYPFLETSIHFIRKGVDLEFYENVLPRTLGIKSKPRKPATF